MGQLGAHFAMQAAIDLARTTGIAAAAVRGSNHCGALAYFARQALPHDMIGLATTDALPTMAPWGGAERLLGINPLAVAIPAGEEPPVVYDAAFSGSSHGKIRIYRFHPQCRRELCSAQGAFPEAGEDLQAQAGQQGKGGVDIQQALEGFRDRRVAGHRENGL
jgi:hypothetical protein